MSRPRLIAGIALLVLGAAAVAMSARVLSTFLLEVVVQTIEPDTGREIPARDYSWGTMVWGNMMRDFSIVSAGLVLIGIGQSLVVPPALMRGGSMLQRCALVGGAVVTLVAAGSYFFVPHSTMEAFRMLAGTGAVGPDFMGEQLAIGASRVFVGCLGLAQLLFIVAALAAGRPAEEGQGMWAPGRQTLVRVACTCMILFALSILFVRLVPVRMIAEFTGPATTAADPAKLARLFQEALRTMLLATSLLAGSGVLILIASLLPKRRPDVG